ncbi:MAG TPA: tripartite tricarboxylate transporter TctB family protein [Thermodesulfobacteriota bacterium]
MPPARLRDGELLSGAALAGLGVYIVSEASQWSFLGPTGPGPGFFPVCYGVAMVVLSLVLVGRRLFASRPARGGEAPNRHGVAVALLTWLAFALTIPLMKYLGFLVAFGLLTFFVVVVVFRRSIAAGVAAAVLCPAAFQLVFPVLLQVRLPVGRFGF